jgi:hypothetical protein
MSDFLQWVRDKVAPPTPTAPSSHRLTPVAETPDEPIDLPSSLDEISSMTVENEDDKKASVWARIFCGRSSAGQQVIDARLKERRRMSPEGMNRLRELGIRLD